MRRSVINKTLQFIASVTLGLAVLSGNTAHAQSSVGAGVCVEAPGMPCVIPPSPGGYSYSRTYVDPAVLEARRQAKEAKRRERQRTREVKKKNRTPYKGVTNRQRNARNSIGKTLFRIDGNGGAKVDSVTYEKVPGYGGEIFVPDGDLGNIALLRPVNPTLSETKVASENLAKAGAVLNSMQIGQMSAEEIAFRARESALIMIGGRSYIHVVVQPIQIKFKDDPPYEKRSVFDRSAPVVTALTNSLNATQVSIRKSEEERAEILKKAKKDISELAGLQVQISETKSEQKKKKLQKRSRELANNMDTFEEQYFTKVEEEKKLEQKVSVTAARLKNEVEWTMGAPILIDADGNLVSGETSTRK